MPPQREDHRGDAAWTDPVQPPSWGEGLTKVRGTDLLWSVWLDDSPDHPHIWHWCTRALLNAKPGVTRPRPPGWSLSGSALHGVPQRDPLTLTPSVHWPDCCGLHGFITNGEWQGVG